MSIKLIVAVTEDWAIGYKNELLYRIPEDLKRFRELTKGNITIFGRHTFESLPVQPLPNRINVVLSRDKKYVPPPTVFKMNSVEHILNHYSTANEEDKDIYVCGGSGVYSDFLPYADEVLVTYIESTADNADTYFDREKLEELFYIGGIEHNYCEENDLKFHYVTYKRKQF